MAYVNYGGKFDHGLNILPPYRPGGGMDRPGGGMGALEVYSGYGALEVYSGYGVIASARNITRMNAALKRLRISLKEAKRAGQKRRIQRRIDRLSRKIKDASEKAKRKAKQRRDKGKKVSSYRRKSLAAASQARRDRTRRGKRRSVVPAFLLDNKSPPWYRGQKPWAQLSPGERKKAFRKHQRRQQEFPRGRPPGYRRPPQQSPYEPNGLQAEQDYEMDSSIYESGTPSADMMSPWDQEASMEAAEIDSGIDVDEEIYAQGSAGGPAIKPWMLVVGALAVGGGIFALTRQKRRKVKSKRSKKVTYR